MRDTFEPDVATRRRMLEQKRDTLRAEGYSATIEAESLLAQPKRDGKVQGAGGQLIDEETYTRGLRTRSTNCYAAARRMQQMIDELPAEKEGD